MDAKTILEDVKQELKSSIKFEMIKPSIAVIELDTKYDNYFNSIAKMCNEVGIYFREFKFLEGTKELTIINKIKELNNDEYVNGIMIINPIPDIYNGKRLINTITNSKDVDGLTDINIGRLMGDRKTFTSGISQAIIEFLGRNNVELEGKDVTLIGRGKVIANSLIKMLLDLNASVTICHSKTKDLKKHTLNSDIIISAVGKKNLITDDMVSDGAIIIDVGLDYDNDCCGDVDYDNVSKKASLITTTKDGMGSLGIAMLLKNVIYCYQNKKK